MKKLWALCLTALAISCNASWTSLPFDTELSSLALRYETVKTKILPIEDNKEYAKKTQERWNNSQNAKTANICIWVDENDDNILHVRYRGQSCSLKYDELVKNKNASYLNGKVLVNNNTDGRWLNVRVVSQLGCGANIFWYKGSIIIRYTGYYRSFDTDESFALLAENVYIDFNSTVFQKITVAAKNELWNLNELYVDWLDVCELISYRIYNFGTFSNFQNSLGWNGLSLFFAKFYKEIAQPEHLMPRGFFSCHSIYIKRPVTVEDLPISLYRTAIFLELTQIGNKDTKYIKIAQSNTPNDLVNRWIQYFDPQNNELHVKIGQLNGTTNINYKFSDDRIDLPEIENCIKSDTKEDYTLPKVDIRQLVHEEAIRHSNSTLDFVHDNGNIKVNAQDSQTTNENGIEMAKGYKSQIKCNGKKISDITFDLVPAFESCCNVGNISHFVFYTKEGLPFSYEVDAHLSSTLGEYIFNKTIGGLPQDPDKITFDEKVDFFNKHGHAPK